MPKVNVFLGWRWDLWAPSEEEQHLSAAHQQHKLLPRCWIASPTTVSILASQLQLATLSHTHTHTHTYLPSPFFNSFGPAVSASKES